MTTSMTRLALAIFLAMAATASPLAAQSLFRDSHVNVQAGYTMAANTGDGIHGARGVSAQVRGAFPLSERFGITARLGLDRLAVDQPDAVDQWGWGYWDVLWENWSNIYANRENHEASFRPVQNLNLLGGSLGPSLTMGGGAFRVSAWVGPSASYFTRVLYQEETWSRFYPSIEHTFSYTIRNYAPDKTGWVFGLDGGAAGSLRLADWLSVSGGAAYRRFFEPAPDFPFNDLLTLNAGLVFHY
jgi:hypothetical protein